MNDPEVQQLATTLNVHDQMQVMSFGKEPAVEVSRFSDKILSNMQVHKIPL